jgi:hypothetical protein
MTRRESIMQALFAALSGTTGVGTRIYRSRVEPVARAESPALVLETISNVPSQNTSLPTLDHVLTVRVVVIIRANVPDQASDPIVESLHSKLVADLSLGGLAIDVQPGPTEFTLEQADTPVGVIYCTYRILYRTSVGDLSVGA